MVELQLWCLNGISGSNTSKCLVLKYIMKEKKTSFNHRLKYKIQVQNKYKSVWCLCYNANKIGPTWNTVHDVTLEKYKSVAWLCYNDNKYGPITKVRWFFTVLCNGKNKKWSVFKIGILLIYPNRKMIFTLFSLNIEIPPRKLSKHIILKNMTTDKKTDWFLIPIEVQNITSA